MTGALIYLQLFWVFFKQGILGFGGGYAILALLEHDVVEHYAWLSQSDFADIVAMSQMTPGPISINAATYVGYHAAFDAMGGTVAAGVFGSLLASLAVCLPSLFLIWVVLRYLLKHKANPVVAATLQALKLISVALIAAVSINMMNRYNFIDYRSILIFAAVFGLSFWRRFRPILCILVCGALGYFLYGCPLQL